jgi:hypothetical protein
MNQKLYETYCDVLEVLETPFGLLLRLFTTSLVATTITFYNVRSSVLILCLG